MSARSGLCAFLDSDVAQIFGQIVSIRVKTLCNTNLLVSRHFRQEKASSPVNIRHL